MEEEEATTGEKGEFIKAEGTRKFRTQHKAIRPDLVGESPRLSFPPSRSKCTFYASLCLPRGTPLFCGAWSNGAASAAVTPSNGSGGHGEAPLHRWAPTHWALGVSLPCLAHDILQTTEAASEVNNSANPLYLLGDDPRFFILSLSGMAFLPASISYLIGTNLFGILANKMGR